MDSTLGCARRSGPLWAWRSPGSPSSPGLLGSAGGYSRSELSRSCNSPGTSRPTESVLSFKAVQSRIIVLPFDEGASVKRETVIARVEDANSRREATIAETSVAVERREFDAAARNRDAAQEVICPFIPAARPPAGPREYPTSARSRPDDRPLPVRPVCFQRAPALPPARARQ